MKRFLCTAAILICCNYVVHAQKATVEGNIIQADGTDYARVEKDGCGAFDAQCQYYISSLSNKRLFIVKHLQFSDPDEQSAANPKGTVHYLQYIFSQSGEKAETPMPATVVLRAKDVARLVVKAHMLNSGELDEAAAAAFVNNNGTPFSDRRNKLGGPAVIIIEK